MAADDGLNIQVFGVEDVDALLAEFEPEFRRTCVEDGVRAMLTVVKAGCKQRAPILRSSTNSKDRQPGALRDCIDIIMDPTDVDNPSRVGGIVTNTFTKTGVKADDEQDPGVWGKFEEEGSIHNAAQPFMRPTCDEDGEAAISACMSTIGSVAKLSATCRALNFTVE